MSPGGKLRGEPSPAETKPTALQHDDVMPSLRSFRREWDQKVRALGRPRLFLPNGGLERLRLNLSNDPKLRADLMKVAEDAARTPAKPYITVEEQERRMHLTHFRAIGEAWMIEVATEIWGLNNGLLIDGSARFKDRLKQKVLMACSYPTWGTGMPDQSVEGPNMDIPAADLINAISAAWDWHPGIWTPAEKEQLLKAMAEKVHSMLVGVYGGAYWSKAPTINHNHISVSALGLAGVAFYDDIPEAPEWLAAARLNFQTVAASLPADGSSGEGFSYWSYGLSRILRYIEGTRGVIDSAELYKAAFLRNAGNARLHASTSGFDSVLPWGDAYLRDLYGPQHILYAVAAANGDPTAQWLAQHLPFEMVNGDLENIFLALWRNPALPAAPPLRLDDRQSVGEIATTRNGWGGGDYLLSVKSGWTNRNHTHLDAGALAIAFGYDWLLTAPGRGLGAGDDDFWRVTGPRWRYLSNASESETTLVIDEQNQKFDEKARATIDSFFSAPQWVWISNDLTGAYAGVQSVRRSVLHRRGDYILVFDRVVSPASHKIEWLAQLAPPVHPFGKALEVLGDSGGLRVQMLAPAAEFQARKPKSPIIDIPVPVIGAYAVTEKGSDVSFVALLQPLVGTAGRSGRIGVADEAAPGLDPVVTENAAGEHRVTLHGAGWNDQVAWRQEPGEIADRNLKSTARLLSWRTDGEGVESVFACEATILETGGLRVLADRTAEIALQRIGRRSWILDLDRKLSDQIRLEGGDSVLALAEPTSDGIAQGQSFRYLISRDGTTLAQAESWLAAQVRFTPRVPRAITTGAKLPPAPATARIEAEAEDYAWQRAGAGAQIESAFAASGGHALRSMGSHGFGNGEHHSVTWVVQAKQAGTYHLKLRYCTLRSTTLAVMVDGAAPSPAALQIGLAATGGWSTTADNWREEMLRDPKTGQPIEFPLTAGEHEVRLGEIPFMLALDKFTFVSSDSPAP